MKEEKYYHTKESVDEYIKLAEGFSGNELITSLKTFLPKKSTLLEIGSGPGTDWNILNKTYSVTGSDNSNAFINHLKSSNPNGEFIMLDAATLKVDNKFDGIYSNKVLHHLTDNELKTSILRQKELLNPNGIICHSFWKGEGDETFKGMYVKYHTQKALLGFFEEHFDLLVLENYQEFDADDSILLIGRKK